MKRILALTTAALMSTGIAGSALAQDLDLDIGAGAGAETGVEAEIGTDDLNLGATGAAQADANLGTVVSALNSGRLGTAEVEAATEISSVHVIRIDELPGGGEQQAIDQALDRHQAEVDELRAAVGANAEIAGELEAEGVSTQDVVAAEVNGDGSVTVYVH